MRIYGGLGPVPLDLALRRMIGDLAGGCRNPLILSARAALDDGRLAECLELVEQMQRQRTALLTGADPPE